MKTALLLACSLATAAFAADPKPASARNSVPESGQVKKLGAVTWDVENHKLVWKVLKGSMVNGEFVTISEEQYEVSPDQARMAKSDEERGFGEDEAVALHRLLDTLSLYCAESVVWWDRGQGEPLQPGHTPTAKPDKPVDSKPVKVNSEEPKEKPKYHVPDNHLVARAVAK
jgi:hypothetical protein